MSLKLGTWKLNANGFETTLDINSVNESGAVQGTMGSWTGGAPLNFIGIWDDTERSISFFPSLPAPSPASVHYRGFLLSTPTEPQPGQDVLWTLTGFFDVADPTAPGIYQANARRHIFGWFAQITEVF